VHVGTHRGRVPELDGLRGVAVLLVVAAHATVGISPHYNGLGRLPIAGGGFIGVQLFFVLSGFLITGVLLREAQEGSVSWRGFYLRRAGRLLPALFLVVATLGAIGVIWGVEDAGGDALLALTYTANLEPLTDRVTHAGWLGHTWSLAVEEQFYLVWPLVFLATFRAAGERGVAAAAVLGASITVVLRHQLPQIDAYTTLRWDALMAGCWLAAAKPALTRAWGLAGALLLAPYIMEPPWPIEPMDYSIATIGCVAVVAAAPHARLLQSSILRYLGRISYGLYLWHALLGRLDVTPAITVPISVVLAEISFRTLEEPVLAWVRGRSSGRSGVVRVNGAGAPSVRTTP